MTEQRKLMTSRIARKTAVLFLTIAIVTSGFSGYLVFGTGTASAASPTDWEYSGTSHNTSELPNRPSGMVEGPDGHWYVADEAEGNVYEYYSNFSYTGNSYNLSSELTGNLEDIHYDGGTWYAVDTGSDAVYEYDSSWTYTGTSHDVSTEDGYMTGLESKNGNFYLTGNNNVNVYKYNSSWGYEKSWSVSEVSIPDDLSFDKSGYLYVSGDNGITEYDTSITATGKNFSISKTGTPDGLWIGGDGYWYVADQDYNELDRYVNAEAAVTGRVLNQYDQPVSNATVQYWAINHSKVTPDAGETAKEEARDVVQNYSDPTPEGWKPNLDPKEKFSEFSNQGGHYVAVTHGEVSGDPWLGSADLGEPVVSVPSGTELVFTVWDGSKTGTFGIQDDYDAALPGSHVSDKSAVVERISPGNQSTDKTYLAMTEKVSTGTIDKATLRYNKRTLPDGFYKVHPQGAPGNAYYIKVGKPVKAFYDGIKNETTDKVTDHSKELRQKLQSGLFQIRTVKTNESGYYAASLSPNYKTVGIQAYKAGGALGPDASISDLRNVSQNSNRSVAISTAPTVASVPSSSADVRVHEFTTPPFQNLSTAQNRYEWLNSLLNNESYSELPPALQQRLNATSDQQLEEVYSEVSKLTEENQRLKNRVQTLLKQQSDNETIIVNTSSATNQQLRDRITAIQQAMAELRSTVSAGETQTSTSNGNVSISQAFDTNLKPDQVAVKVMYSNGTTEMLNTSSQYVSIENSPGDDTVKVSNLPLGNAASAQFRFIVANDAGIGNARETVTNPNFSGEVPSLEAISVSSLRPGPNQSMEVSLQPESPTQYGSLQQVTVYGPNGKVNSTVTDSKTATWSTNKPGIYHVKADYTSNSGKQFSTTFRVLAGKSDANMPPSVRVKSSPVGTYALAGDGLESGSVEVSDGGSSVEVVAQVDSQDTPSEIGVYTTGAEIAPDNTMTVRVVEGASQKAIGQHVKVRVHMAGMDDNALLYREGKPLPRGETKRGKVLVNETRTTIQTYTDETGSLTLRTDSDPGIVQRALYEVEKTIPNVGNVFGSMVPSTALSFPGVSV